LRNVPLFAGLDENELEKALKGRGAQARRALAAFVVRAGDSTDSLYILLTAAPR
jgi:hypothetical protein